MERGRKGVILDRDGILVIPEFRDGRSFAPLRLDEFRIYPEAPGAVRRLKAAGFVVVVATNQPDVGAGRLDRRTLDAMHERLRAEVAIDDIEVCCETREQASERRKPGAGMLFDAAQTWGLDLARCYAVGDRVSDVEAAVRAGCIPVFVDHGYVAEPRPSAQAATVSGLSEAVEWILAHERRSAPAMAEQD